MKSSAAADPMTPDALGASPTKRRGLLIGAGIAGAAAIAAKAWPTATVEVAAVPATPKTDEPSGYRLTQHVLRYYETTKV